MPVEGTEWAREGAPGQTLAFEDGRVHGSGGVNRFAGEYALDGDRLSLGPLAATRMAGSPEANQAELDFFAALERAASATLADGVLSVAGADGAELLRFVPATPTEPEEAPETWS
jgi:heat shock protein HslJ